MKATYEYGREFGRNTGAEVPACPYSGPFGPVKYGHSNGHWAEFGRNTGGEYGQNSNNLEARGCLA